MGAYAGYYGICTHGSTPLLKRVVSVGLVHASSSIPPSIPHNFLPSFLPSSQGDDPNAVSFDSSKLWLDDVAGVIGPFYPDVAARVVPITSNNLDILSVSLC